LEDTVEDYIADRMTLSMPEGCTADLSTAEEIDYTRGTYLKIGKIEVASEESMTDEDCAAVLSQQLGLESSVDSLQYNALFDEGGLMASPAASGGYSNVSIPSDLASRERQLFRAKGYMPVASERCSGGAMELMEMLTDFTSQIGDGAPHKECSDRDDCTAVMHYSHNKTLLLWRGTPNLATMTDDQTAVVKHPLCSVKVTVFDSSLPALPKPCRCDDGSFPVRMCGSTVKSGSGNCPDGSTPTNACADASTCQVGTTAAPTTTTPAPSVKVTYTISNMNYSKVETNATLKNEIIDAVKEGVLASLTGYAKSDLSVALSSGSIVAEVTIMPKGQDTAEMVGTQVTQSKSAMETSVSTKVTEVPGVDQALDSGMSLSDVSTASVVAAPTTPAPTPGPSDTSSAAASMLSLTILVSSACSAFL
jgi:hypothetical protein